MNVQGKAERPYAPDAARRVEILHAIERKLLWLSACQKECDARGTFTSSQSWYAVSGM